MTVTRRLRYEVLRRDRYACRYCGAKAPDVELTVDHVTPKALGGTDTADNLVASCQPCNAGKTSTGPDAPLVADVAAEALEWARNVRQVLEQMAVEDGRILDAVQAVLETWETLEGPIENASNRAAWRPSYLEVDDAHGSIERFVRYGLPYETMAAAIEDTVLKIGVSRDRRFRYFCGICWAKIKEAEDRVAGRP